MLAQLQPYIVISWHGHRNDANIPAVVKSVWRRKFQPPRGGFQQRQSNVDLALLNSEGVLVHTFDAAQHEQYGRGGIQQFTVRELSRAAPFLGLGKAPAKERPVKLPTLGGQRGLRVLVSLRDDRMRAYRAPVVEVVPTTKADWKPLAWPAKERTVKASALKSWLSQIYPPGVMERTNPVTKVVYAIKAVEGKLKLSPLKSEGEDRQAILSGVVRLIDEGPGEFSYQGILEVVLTYGKGETSPQTLRGYFDGLYPRSDRMHRDIRWLPLQAAIESIPEVLEVEIGGDREDLLGGEMPGVAVGGAAPGVLLVEHQHALALTRQRQRAGHADETGTDDDDIGIGRSRRG